MPSVRDGIPPDIWAAASTCSGAPKVPGGLFSENYVRPIARAILAERERCAAIADKYAKDAFAACEGDAAAAGREIAVAIRTPATSA